MVTERFEPNNEGHRVGLVGKVGPMVVMDQVFFDNQVDPEKDRRVFLVAQHSGHTEHVVSFVVQHVVLVVGRFSPEEHKIVLMDSEVDPKDLGIVDVGPKVFLVKVGAMDHMVVPANQRQGLTELNVVPQRVVLASQRAAQAR